MTAPLKVNDHVIITDPDYGEQSGYISFVDDTTVIVDGPRLDTRTIQFTVSASMASTHIRPFPQPHTAKHRRGPSQKRAKV